MRLKYISIVLLLLSIAGINCNIEEMPVNEERSITYKLILQDNSGYMSTLYGSNMVRNAEIILRSKMQGKEYKIQADSNGTAEISGILSDDYLVTADRWMTADEMKIIEGVSRGDIKLTNVNNRIIRLSPGSGNEINILMERVIGSSPLVISEIYACGPPGAGLYYHDKYVEVYNQSDSILYLDSLMIAVVYVNSYLGIHYRDDPDYVHSKSIWIFPGTGSDYPIMPGQFVLCAEDAIDHRINAPNSVDLSAADFEFYKDDAPDVDNPAVPNMIKIYQDSGNDWLIGGEKGSLIIARYPADSLKPYDDQFLIPYKSVLDGVEYMSDPTKLENKILNPSVDAGTTGGIQFYTGKSMERITAKSEDRRILKDDNNSSVDLQIIQPATPCEYH